MVGKRPVIFAHAIIRATVQLAHVQNLNAREHFDSHKAKMEITNDLVAAPSWPVLLHG